jgi:hypothetical protein
MSWLKINITPTASQKFVEMRILFNFMGQFLSPFQAKAICKQRHIGEINQQSCFPDAVRYNQNAASPSLNKSKLAGAKMDFDIFHQNPHAHCAKQQKRVYKAPRSRRVYILINLYLSRSRIPTCHFILSNII